ncbi:MAG TPA: hypothetical protein VM733_01220 [Thermoanaerobaculia bacterium]|nr:hypothetical protein [Thermoanaerobaculia bacterium]
MATGFSPSLFRYCDGLKPVATFVVLLSLVACQEAPTFPTATPEDVGAAQVSEEDRAVYEALVAAYAKHGQLLGLRWSPPHAPMTLADVARITAENPLQLYDHTRIFPEIPQLDRARWVSLVDERLPPMEVPRDALQDLARRNQHPVSLKNYQPPYIHFERTKDSMGSPITGAIFSLTLPGYSAARDAAFVELGISTSGLSGGTELHYLRKTNGRWRVLARQMTSIS